MQVRRNTGSWLAELHVAHVQLFYVHTAHPKCQTILPSTMTASLPRGTRIIRVDPWRQNSDGKKTRRSGLTVLIMTEMHIGNTSLFTETLWGRRRFGLVKKNGSLRSCRASYWYPGSRSAAASIGSVAAWKSQSISALPASHHSLPWYRIIAYSNRQ